MSGPIKIIKSTFSAASLRIGQVYPRPISHRFLCGQSEALQESVSVKSSGDRKLDHGFARCDVNQAVLGSWPAILYCKVHRAVVCAPHYRHDVCHG